ncbi:hypothetical protein DICSQDRAFT_106734 [Dichomitus squalens LYAD-421 SS1]|uniref:Cep57 centrosome microtubule-binding domain-containing protein n=1 Tax=Dichomitus squalens (strain LYAD-421) TaxID=732165 RepID=R7SY16_DICSQ|nr:uncharacterized protein DICSQDRAFT_106734 [Dichomitus squalens LYAD-421 SS1]EJF61064.1 hypothetical protein DICSQDRAFT_106734 [Dichomitus squalens LYAD-421 SS1]
MSGAEYDPERPLQGIMAGIAGRFNGFDANSTKSRQITASVVDFDPLIVDDTAELDRVLQSGHAPPGTIRSARSLSSSSSSDLTEPISPQPQQESRPRLADALSHLTFSPKRPRSAQGFASPRASNVIIRSSTPDRSAIARHLPASTPRPQRRVNQSLSYAQNSVSISQGHAEPEVQITPATPSLRQSHREQQQQQQQQDKEKDESSKFTAMARGLAREIEEEADAAMKRNARQAPTAEATPRAAYRHSTIPMRKHQHHRSPLKEMVNERPERTSYTVTPFKKSVQLPDVTGLTSAIASPTKVDVEFYGYDPKDTTEAEARLIATLTVVQNKLTHLEAENSVSRRRVRELELELEACKQEVARERTRILEHEQSVMRDDEAPAGRKRVQRERPQQQQQQQQQKKAGEDQAELAAAEARYRAAVDEKKALEALIGTLRTHLTRLTAELSEHKQLLLELRALRDSDARALAEKSREVDKLRQEVERLAGEVEVLRGVVEEGLKERRSFREQSVSHEQGSATESAGQNSEEESGDEEDAREPQQQQQQQQQRARPPSVHSEDSEDEATEEDSISRRSPTPSPRRRLSTGAADKTMRTDIATVASSQTHNLSVNPNASKPFLDEEEVSRIAQEVEERRSERSIQSRSQDSQSASGSQEGSRSWSRQPNPNQSRRPSRAGSPSVILEPDASGSTALQNAVPQLEYSVRFAEEVNRATSSRPTSPYLDTTQAQAQSQPRPSAPTPATAAAARAGSQKRRTHAAAQSDGETPFPQIRGAQLERLFFSAPEHNSETCTVCHRRRRRRPADVEQAASWLREQRRHRAKDEDEDEGFVEGAEDARDRRAYAAKAARDGESGRVPPQTVLARVLRELEDDFTHYKSIYVELADQYKDMDPVSNVVKRNVLADHLREVIDILEQKGNQIASLYDLLTFKDKPVSESVVPDRAQSRNVPRNAGTAQGRVPIRRYPSS